MSQVPCPGCGTTLSHIGTVYECPSCLDIYTESEVVPTRDLLVGSSVNVDCPKCGQRVDMETQTLSGNCTIYVCPECNTAHFDRELGLEEESESLIAFYATCTQCEVASVIAFDSSHNEYLCEECGSLGSKDELIGDIYETVKGENGCTCCPDCGNQAQGKHCEGETITCWFCLKKRVVQKFLSCSCTHCYETTSGYPNVLHLGMDNFQHEFLCLDCNQIFKKDKALCCHCGNVAPISEVSRFGLLFHCDNCNLDFQGDLGDQDVTDLLVDTLIDPKDKRSSKVGHDAWDGLLGFDDSRSWENDGFDSSGLGFGGSDYTSWGPPKKSLKELLAEKFVLEVEL